MENKALKFSITVLVTTTLLVTSIIAGMMYGGNQIYADTEDDNASIVEASKELNRIGIPNNIKRGIPSYITVNGDRYNNIIEKYRMYLNGDGDRDIFSDGEEFFQVSSINIQSIKKVGSKLNTTYNYSIDPYKLAAESFGMSVKLGAGKYKITATFKKRAVALPANESTLNFVPVDATNYTKTDSFYVKSKVKFQYNKKYGKMAKTKRTSYLNPGEKYGTLPKPKAKKGYKFKGWYTKSKGGKKVKKSTRVPVKDDIVLYAKYVKK